MDWWSRLLGGGGGGGDNGRKRAIKKSSTNDPEVRLGRFRRTYQSVLELCNRQRDLTDEKPILDEICDLLTRIDALLREETRTSAPHLVLHFAAKNQIHNVITRAAAVSGYEPLIRAAISVLATLVDSEEEDFLSSASFAKGLTRLATKALDSDSVKIDVNTETAILEVLFTVVAKIRLQPDILPFWFYSSVRSKVDNVFDSEKDSFAGLTHKESFPLCYLLINRVHREGRIGDFARTGMLYIFQTTGRSVDLEEWVISGDLPTLMASGLGALYSQLSRELSILHPDSTLPAVLAMSDYSTTYPRVTAESAFSEDHKGHMATFLSYLAFWQDILDRCPSPDVKHTLLDHFQILFLQQLLYPSLLQSSDSDEGSSVAVLTYMTTMLESLEYPDLVNTMLSYLLNIEQSSDESTVSPKRPTTPHSPTAARIKQSLLLVTAPRNPEEAVEPSLFSLVDLILNNMDSENSQAVFAALKLASTLLTKHKSLAFGSLLKAQALTRSAVGRTVGALDLEVEKLIELTASVYGRFVTDTAYDGVVEDVRVALETQLQSPPVPSGEHIQDIDQVPRCHLLQLDAPLMRRLLQLLRTFFTNGVEVNVALTGTIVSIAISIDIRLDSWLALDHSSCASHEITVNEEKSWHAYLDDEEKEALHAQLQAARQPAWSDTSAPAVFRVLQELVQELESIRTNIPNLDHLIAGRKEILQTPSLGLSLISSEPQSSVGSPVGSSFLEIPEPPNGRSSSISTEASNDSTSGRATTSVLAESTPSNTAALPIRSRSSEGRSRSPAGPAPQVPSTTDVLMQTITLAGLAGRSADEAQGPGRKASLNHILTNVVVLQEFMLELVAVLQVRAAALGADEVKLR